MDFGIGFRPKYLDELLRDEVRLDAPKIDFLELLSDNYFSLNGELNTRPFENALRLAERYPILLHGVSLNLGSKERISKRTIRELKRLKSALNALWISDHNCFNGVDGKTSHDLLPIPYNRKYLDVICRNIIDAQDQLGDSIVLENVSTYFHWQESTMSESEFIARIVDRTKCRLLIDLNNIYVNSVNHGFDPFVFLKQIPSAAIQQIHVAGHSVLKGVKGHLLLVDTHDSKVHKQVHELYGEFLSIHGHRPLMIEWDANLPPLKIVHNELRPFLKRLNRFNSKIGKRSL